MKQGERVTVKLFGGRMAERIIVQIEENTAIICNEQEWDMAHSEHREPQGIRLPISDLKINE
jgi:hypothetical protein